MNYRFYNKLGRVLALVLVVGLSRTETACASDDDMGITVSRAPAPEWSPNTTGSGSKKILWFFLLTVGGVVALSGTAFLKIKKAKTRVGEDSASTQINPKSQKKATLPPKPAPVPQQKATLPPKPAPVPQQKATLPPKPAPPVQSPETAPAAPQPPNPASVLTPAPAPQPPKPASVLTPAPAPQPPKLASVLTPAPAPQPPKPMPSEQKPQTEYDDEYPLPVIRTLPSENKAELPPALKPATPVVEAVKPVTPIVVKPIEPKPAPQPPRPAPTPAPQPSLKSKLEDDEYPLPKHTLPDEKKPEPPSAVKITTPIVDKSVETKPIDDGDDDLFKHLDVLKRLRNESEK